MKSLNFRVRHNIIFYCYILSVIFFWLFQIICDFQI